MDDKSPIYQPKDKAYWSTKKLEKKERKVPYAGDPEDVQPAPIVQLGQIDHLEERDKEFFLKQNNT